MPHRSQPEHLSASTTCGGWYPLELNAELSARTLVGQNSTQNPQALHRSTTIDTEPRAIESPFDCLLRVGRVFAGRGGVNAEMPSTIPYSILKMSGPRGSDWCHTSM